MGFRLVAVLDRRAEGILAGSATVTDPFWAGPPGRLFGQLLTQAQSRSDDTRQSDYIFVNFPLASNVCIPYSQPHSPNPMKTTPIIALFPLLGTVAFGATTASFDGGADTPIFLNQFGATPGASIQPAGGNPDGYLQLTANANDQNNFATFDLSDPGASFSASTFTFQFRVDNLGAGGADGFSFNYYPTAIYGTTGALVGSAPFAPEDPAGAGVLGFGFDTWGNGGTFDANGNSADYSEITLFFDGALINRIDDTRLLANPLNLKDGAWHTVNGTVDTAGATVTMSVDGNPIFDSVAVPGLVAAEARVGYAGRTGNANEQVSIDNVNVQFVPEPGVIGALAVGSLVLLRRRRR